MHASPQATLGRSLLDALGPDDLDALAERLAPRLRAMMGDAEPERVSRPLSPHEAAERARTHPETIRRAVRSGALPASRAGRSIRVDPADLDTWLNRPPSQRAEPVARRAPARRSHRRPLGDALAQLDAKRCEKAS